MEQLGWDDASLYNPVVEAVGTELGMSTALWLLDEAAREMRIVAYCELPEAYAREVHLSLDEPSVARTAFETGKTQVVANIATDPRWKYKEAAAAQGFRSAMVVPLKVKGRVVGILDVYSSELREFDPLEQVLMENYAEQAASVQRRIRDMRVLNEINLQLNSDLERSALLRHIVDAAEQALRCQHVGLFLVGPAGLDLESASAGGVTRQHFAIGEGLAGWVAQYGQGVLQGDALHDPRYTPGSAQDKQGLSMVLAPIRLGDEVVGVISADEDRRDAFDEHDLALLTALADQAALALRNAEVLRQAEDRASALARLHEVGARILSQASAGLREVLTQIAQAARSVLGADLVDIYEYVQDEDRYPLPAVLEGDRRVPGIVKDAIYEDDVIVQVVRSGEALYTVDAQSQEEFIRPYSVDRPDRPEVRFVIREGIRSSAAIPLKAAGQTVGVVFANYRTPQSFDAQQRQLIELFAAQAAAAILNARAQDTSRNLIEAQTALIEFGQAVAHSAQRPRDEDVLQAIWENAGKLMDTDNMYIALYDETSDRVRFGLAYVDGQRVDVATTPGWQPRRAGHGRTEEIIRTRTPLFHATREASEAWYRQEGHQEYIGTTYASWIGVPILLGQRVLGVIATYHPTLDHVYNRTDLAILQVIASQAAIALDNARIYYDVNLRLWAVTGFAQTLNAKLGAEEAAILELIREYTSELMDTGNMYIALYDAPTDTVRFGLAYEDGQPIDTATREGWQPRRAGRGRTEAIIRTREPIFCPTRAESEAWYAQPGHEEYTGNPLPSWLGVPMRLGDRVLGVIAVYHPTTEYLYDRDDQLILQTFADQAAVALENSRLYAEAIQLRDALVAENQLASLGAAMGVLEHRINNSFMLIIPNIGRLRTRVDLSDPDIAEALEIIERNARETDAVMRRIQEPLREITPVRVNVEALLHDVVKATSDKWGSEHPSIPIAVSVLVPSNLPIIRAPSGQLAEVFRNLVENAFRAMRDVPERRLTVRASLREATICVDFCDTGPGIPEHIQQDLFRKPVSSRKTGGGMGLGLFLGAIVLRSLGGCAKIEATGTTGTTIRVELPVSGPIGG